MNNDEKKWNAIYAQTTDTVIACDVLRQNVHLLPVNAKTLDYACGLGGNALLLAKANFDSHAWDISQEAISKLSSFARSESLDITTQVRDLELHPPAANTFDVVVVSNYLHRPTFPDLIKSLTRNGLLFYQTFIKNKIEDIGPSNPDYLLDTNELLTLCGPLEVLVYREEGKQGDPTRGWRNQAMIVAKNSKF